MIAKSKKQGLIFIISGPSGSGKTTLVKKLLGERALKNKLSRSISLTTRPARSGEQNKQDYFFISQAQFQKKKTARKLLEWTKYLGHYYATPRDFIERQLETAGNIILCLDLKGAFQIKRFYPKNTVMIFVLPPSHGALFQRITKRCHKTQAEEVRQRLNLAQKELKAAKRYDYCLVNKEITQATRELKDILLKEIKHKN